MFFVIIFNNGTKDKPLYTGQIKNNLITSTIMVITFNELRRIKDKLPSGSSQRIANELGIDVDKVRNYFGGSHFSGDTLTGVHFEKGPDGGVVTLDDTSIFDAAMRILEESK